MKIFATFLSLLILPATIHGIEPGDKIGTVNMKSIFAEYHKTKDLAEDFQGYRTEIEKERDVRIEKLKALAADADKLKKGASDPSLSGEKKRELFTEFQTAQADLQGMSQELEGWLQRKQAALVEKQRMEFEAIRGEIVDLVAKYGEAEGYDLIFDRSGDSASGVEILLYTKDAANITPQVLEMINKSAPKKEQEQPAESP